MIELGRPAVALVGALLALLPIALHFISRRAPESAPLPTARFLTPERFTRVHFHNRPSDLAHLGLRVLFLLAMSLAFAAPRFSVGAGGTADVILLDASVAMRPYWGDALDSVRAIVSRSGSALSVAANSPTAQENSTSDEGGAAPGGASTGRAASSEAFRSVRDRAADRGRVTIVVLGAAPRAISVTEFVIDSLVSAPPTDGGVATPPAADLSVALTALRETAASLPADSARAWLVFTARRDSWRPGFGELRGVVWPGIIGVVALTPSDSAGDPLDPREAVGNPSLPEQATVHASSEAEAEVIGAALEALGVSLVEAASATSGGGAVIALSGSAADLGAANGALARGATVLLGPSSHDALPGVDPIWLPASTRAIGSHPLIRFRDGLTVAGVQTRSGRAAPGVRWLAATGDGQPAVVASPVGRGCVVTAAFDMMSLMEHAPASMPDVLSLMLAGCVPSEPRPDDALPLDEGALTVLRGAQGGLDGPGLPPAVALGPLRGDPPDPLLVRGLLLLALTAAVAEAYLSYGHRRGPIRATSASER